jgi:hypothetical protein
MKWDADDVNLKLVHGERPTIELLATQVEWNALEFDKIAMKAKVSNSNRTISKFKNIT